MEWPILKKVFARQKKCHVFYLNFKNVFEPNKKWRRRLMWLATQIWLVKNENG
jgi:hypothetical protein